MITELTLFIVFLLLCMIKLTQKPKGLPPGDWGLPFIGLVARGRQHFNGIIISHQKRYGNGLYCVKIGAKRAVLICDYMILRNAFSKIEFSNRPNSYTIHAFGEKLGLTMSSGKVWTTNRRFSVKALRDFGMGRSIMEPIIEGEVKNAINYFDKRVGSPTTITRAIDIAAVNGLWLLTSGRRYDIEDKRIQIFTNMNRESFDVLQSSIKFLDFYPISNYLPQFIKDTFFRTADLRNNREAFKAWFIDVIKEHQANLDESNITNFIDMYLVDAKYSTDPELAFKKNMYNLVHILINFFTGGSQSVSASIRWFINYVAMYPEVQEKIHKELDEHVPDDRNPMLKDKKNLHYFEAVMSESLRHASLFLIGVPHETAADCEIDGYVIPKDTPVISCLEQCNKDPKYWDQPDEFYPERFLTKDGKFNANRIGFVPFSIGRRSCPGESYGKMEIYLLCSALFHQFTIKPAPGVKITHEPARTSPYFNFPKQYEFIFERRIKS